LNTLMKALGSDPKANGGTLSVLRRGFKDLNAQFAMISAGQNHTCGITTQHAAYCWGLNDQGQLGSISAGGPIPTSVDASLPWTQISAGSTHTCGVRSDGATVPHEHRYLHVRLPCADDRRGTSGT